MKNNLKQWNIIIKPAITVYLFLSMVLIMRGVIHKYELNKNKNQILVLNHLMPRSFQYLVDTVKNHEQFDPRRLKSYTRYYQKVTEFMPERADAHGMLGFCLYHLGEQKKAIGSYQQALKYNPNFFWFHYNLAVIYFRSENYEQAAISMKKALETKPERSLLFIQSSKMIYIPILLKGAKDFGNARMQLNAGYKNGGVLLALSHYYLKKEGIQSLPDIKNLPDEIANEIYLKIY